MDPADVALEPTPDGVLLPVRAQPGARRNGPTGVHDGRLRVSVTAAPEKGRANAALLGVLAKVLGVKRSAITLRGGETSRSKVFHVADVSVDVLREQITAALAVE